MQRRKDIIILNLGRVKVRYEIKVKIFEHKHLIPTIKHSVGGLMIWAFFAATAPGKLAVIRLIMPSSIPKYSSANMR